MYKQYVIDFFQVNLGNLLKESLKMKNQQYVISEKNIYGNAYFISVIIIRENKQIAALIINNSLFTYSIFTIF